VLEANNKVVGIAHEDHVARGFTPSPAHGNVTGLSLQQIETVGKRLELLREVVPGLGRLAVSFPKIISAHTDDAIRTGLV
jgi:hypothetical protein